MALEFWPSPSLRISARSLGLAAGAMASVTLLLLYCREKKHRDKSDSGKDELIPNLKASLEEVVKETSEVHKEQDSVTSSVEETHEVTHEETHEEVIDKHEPRGDESLIEWIDRQLKEAEERKKLKESNES